MTRELDGQRLPTIKGIIMMIDGFYIISGLVNRLKNKLLVSLAVFWICDERASRRKAQEQDTMHASFAAGIRQAPQEQSGSRAWHQRYEPKP
jgi:hypothetical protein